MCYMMHHWLYILHIVQAYTRLLYFHQGLTTAFQKTALSHWGLIKRRPCPHTYLYPRGMQEMLISAEEA